MAKVTVEICTGTTCYVMGAAEILELADHLGDEDASRVDITGSSCLDLCKDDQCGKAPFVKVNGTLISEATLTKVITEIRRQMK